MTMHNHVERKAYPKGYCESCDVVWNVLALIPTDYFDLEAELQVAEQLRNDYGMKECLFHLTDKQERGQMIKFELDRMKGLI